MLLSIINFFITHLCLITFAMMKALVVIDQIIMTVRMNATLFASQLSVLAFSPRAFAQTLQNDFINCFLSSPQYRSISLSVQCAQSYIAIPKYCPMHTWLFQFQTLLQFSYLVAAIGFEPIRLYRQHILSV